MIARSHVRLHIHHTEVENRSRFCIILKVKLLVYPYVATHSLSLQQLPVALQPLPSEA